MQGFYVHHRIETKPREWQAAARTLAEAEATAINPAGGALYGVWRSQIGRQRDEVTAITLWNSNEAAARAPALLAKLLPTAVSSIGDIMTPTLRPTHSEAPRRQGNYAFRWFETPAPHWDEFLQLCADAWPGFEAAYDSQVVGLWRCDEPGDGGGIRSLLLTRRPDLSMWERSKIPQGEAETEVRRKLSRRYDLCDWTCVYTTTLLTATDRQDEARWA